MNRLKILSLAVLVAVVLAGCTPQAAPPAAPAPTPTTAAAPQPTSQPTIAVLPATEPTVKAAEDATLGPILVDGNGRTLYLYTNDLPNVSNCYDQCATNWPPLVVGEGEPTEEAGLPGELGTTTRRDGSRQVTYNGTPLYYWVRDSQAGDTTGQGVGNVWFVVPPGTDGLPTVKTTKNEELGTFLTDLKGMTLYRFANDQPNTSSCYGECATNWPPLLVSEGEPSIAGGVPGELGTTTRQDGSRQVTYNGLPLYYWAQDTKPGDTTGQGVNNVWFVVEAEAGM